MKATLLSTCLLIQVFLRETGWNSRILLKATIWFTLFCADDFPFFFRQSRALVRCKNTTQKRNSRVRWKSVVFCNTGMTFVYPLGDYTLPRGAWLVLRRENYVAIPGMDVRVISEGIAMRLGRAERESYREEGLETATLSPSLTRTAEGSEMKGMRIEMVTRYYGNVYAGRFVRMHIRALISFPQSAHFFFRPSGDRIRARACARGGSRIIKDGLTIFPGVPGRHGQCDGALRRICRCTRCCVCFY